MPPPTSTDHVLDAERAHLHRSRDCLAEMRERAGHIADYGVDALASEALGLARAHRLKALTDDASVPPFFGRVDRLPDDDHPGGETFHVGRRHIRDQAGDPLVIDWRAPMARPFYRATVTEPLGLRRRRRFGFADGKLTSYEDELLQAGTAGPTVAATESRILLEEIERPRVGPMRDIVATIQPDQDDIVRAALDDSICVQGAPGTGKTAVGLHRAAYLLYTYPDRLRRSGVLIVGPNRTFLSYIGQVLPALGEVGVRQSSISQLVAAVPVRAEDPPEVATLKGDARMAELARRAVVRGIRRPQESLVVPVGSRRYRVPPERLRRYVDDLRRGEVRYLAARDRLPLLLAEDIRRQREHRGGAPSDSETARVARSAPVRAFVDQVWPMVEAPELLFRLLADRDFLAASADGVLDRHEQRMLSWARPARSVRSARWSFADAVLVDEIAGLLRRGSTFAHVVLDEAQDLSPMQCRAVARRCPTGSLTVLGDLAQGTTPWATGDWGVTLTHLGKPEARVESLVRGYRVPAEAIALANRLLPHLAVGLAPSSSIRRGDGGLRLRQVDEQLPGRALAEEVARLLDHEGSVGVIAADAQVASLTVALTAASVTHVVLGSDTEDELAAELGTPREPGGAQRQPDEPDDDRLDEGPGQPAARVSVVPATLAKGLEFDSVVVVEPAVIAGAEPRGLRRLYVVLTRAVTRLVVLHHQPLPVQLSD